jgi:SAM-dependent methyltransferase
MTFELATQFNEVVGLDNARLCVDKSNELKDNGRASYKLQLEGKIIEEREAIVNPEIDRDRVSFMVGDACALPEDIGQFGLVLITNTLCHLPDPMLFLETMKDRIVPAGILVIVDFYGWDDMYKLPKDRWIAGYENDEGEQVGGFEGLKRILCPHFILLEEKNLQCLVRFGIRHYSLQIDHATVWMRKID